MLARRLSSQGGNPPGPPSLTQAEWEAKLEELKRCGDVRQLGPLLDELHVMMAHADIRIFMQRDARHLSTLLDVLQAHGPNLDDDNGTIAVKLTQLVAVVAKYQCCAFDLKVLFRLLRARTGRYRSPTLKPILAALCDMMARSGPTSFFHFSGKNAGLVLPKIDRWPGKNGYTFCAWIQLSHIQKTPRKHMLYSFLTERGDGMQAFISGQTLVTQSLSYTGIDEARVAEFAFHANRWYFVAISHHHQRMFLLQSKITVFIDGLRVAHESLKYPNLSESLIFCSIGIMPENQGTSFLGQIGPIFFFDGALGNDEVKALHQLGPNRVSSLDPTDSENVHTPQSASKVLNGSIAEKIFLSYHASAVDGIFCLDTSQRSRAGHGLHARRIGDLQCCNTRNVRDLLQCIGGVKVIFPILALLDLPRRHSRHNSSDRLLSDQDDYTADPQLLVYMLQVLIALLRDSPPNREDMENCHGFTLLSFLFQQISPEYLTVDVVKKIRELLNWAELQSSTFLPSQHAGERTLFHEAFLTLLLNFRIWVYADVAVQAEVMSVISQYVERNPAYFRRLVGVQRLFDVLRSFYWFTAEQGSMAVHPIKHPVTKKEVSGRPKEKALKILRPYFLSLIKLMIERGGTPDDIEALMSFLEDCQDRQQLQDVLGFLFQLLFDHQDTPLMASLYNAKGIVRFLALLRMDDPTVRVVTLKILGFLIGKMRRKNPKIESDFAHYAFSSVTHTLQACPFDEQIYAALFEVLVGEISRGSAIGELYAAQRFRQPGVLRCIFRLVRGAEKMFQAKVLQDIAVLLRASSDNCSTMIWQYGWQHWLLSILNGLAEEPNKDDSTVALQEIVMKVFRILHGYSILREKTGWKVLEESMLFAKETLRMDSVAIIRTFLCDVMMQVEAEMPGLDAVQMINPQWRQGTKINAQTATFLDNVLHVITLIEEFMFYVPPPAHPEERGSEKNGKKSTVVMPDLSESLASTSLDSDGSLLEGVLLRGPLSPPLNHEWEIVAEGNERLEEGDEEEEGVLVPPDSTVKAKEDKDKEEEEEEEEEGEEEEEEENDVAVFSQPHLDDAAPHERRRRVLKPRKLTEEWQMVEEEDLSQVRVHRREDGTWEDLELARRLLFVVDALKLTTVTDSVAVLESLHAYDKEKRLRAGGMLRIVLRVALFSLKESDCDVTHENTQRLRHLLERDLSEETQEDAGRLLYVLYHLTRRIASCPTEEDNRRSLFIKLLQDIIQKHHAVLLGLIRESSATSQRSDPDNLLPAAYLKLLIPPEEIPLFQNILPQYIRREGRRVEMEDASFAPWIATRRRKLKEAVLELRKKERMKDAEFARRVEEDRRRALHIRSYAEVNRRAVVVAEWDETQRMALRFWKNAVRSLTNERSPWGDPASLTDQIFWRLDKTEDPRRRRMKLKVNFQGSRHSDARYQYDDRDVKEFDGTQLRRLSRAASMERLPVKAPEPEEEEEVDWNLLNPLGNVEDQQYQSLAVEEKLILSTSCQMVKLMDVIPGRFQVTTTALYFFPDRVGEVKSDADPFNLLRAGEDQVKVKLRKDYKWPLGEIREIHRRRYLLRRRALEIFMVDNTNFFLNFSQDEANTVYNKILSTRPPNVLYMSRSPMKVLQRSNITERWRRWEISNFEYLMALNTIAGRTFNDLDQYPVFPWILADYTCSELDLTNPATFRDLTKPVGALNEERMQQFVERYNTFDDPDIPKFLYGSHYSTAAIVLFYLVRLEPFTSLHLKLQGGHFDCADRLFHSIEECWESCLHSVSNVKELIPEFFYLPDFLTNSNNFDLSAKQDGESVNDVLLPPWAATAEDFVRVHREALESNYVSEHLHAWIDLIFGYKQVGEAAVEAHNVFYYLTYEGKVNIDAIEDPVLRQATESQIACFGQTPSQLLDFPHPKRLPRPRNYHPFTMPTASPQPQAFPCQQASISRPWSIALIHPFSNRIVTLDSDRILALHNWAPNTPGPLGLPFTFEVDRGTRSRRNITENIQSLFDFEGKSAQPRKKVAAPFAEGISVENLSQCVAIPSDGRFVLTCGHWDHTFKCCSVDTGRVVHSIGRHVDVVNCISFAEDARTFVTGSEDTTAIVWEMATDSASTRLPIIPKPRHILSGHDAALTCVSVSTDLDIVVTCSWDLTAIVHTLRRGRFVRTITHPEGLCYHRVLISSQGFIIFYARGDKKLYLYSVNGKLLRSAETKEDIHAMILVAQGQFLLTGGERQIVTVWELPELKIVQEYDGAESSITSLSVSPGEKHMFVGTKEGDVLIYALEEK